MVDTNRRFFLRTKKQVTLQPLPWIKEVSSFTDACTRCEECTRACETGVIVSGDGGFPTVDFTKGECTFCYACANACPETLFNGIDRRPWQQTIYILETCLAKQSVECRSCADVCEPQVIRFRMSQGRVAQPEINITDCTGCGACVSPCPVNAITMETQQ